MPSIISNELNDTKSIKISDIRSNGDSTLRKRRLRSDSTAEDGTKSKSPRRCINGGLNCTENGIIEKESGDNKVVKSRELLVKKLSDDFIDKPKWNPRGTGKSLLMERVKDSLVDWAQGAGFQPPDVLAINCTSLTNTSEIFNSWKKSTPEENLKFYFTIKASSEFVLAKAAINWPEDDRIANAIDLADRFLPRLQSLNCKPMVVTFRAYSKDQIIMILQRRLMALLYIVFQPQALELSARKVAAASGDMRKALCICRSAIEMLQAELRESACNLDFLLAENGYSNQQTTPACDLIKQGIDIVRVDHMAIALSKTYRSPIMDTVQSLPQHQQILLCSAVKLFRGVFSLASDFTLFCYEAFPWGKEGYNYRRGILSGIVFNKTSEEYIVQQLIEIFGIMELSSMCRVLGDQGLLKLGQSREDKLRRVTLKIDEADVAFALQAIRAF
ncbi:unnamed protein product [Camellia sinensis]